MRKLLTLLILLVAIATRAQKIPDYGFNKIRIALSDKVIQADLTPLKSDPAPETDRLYYWSNSNAIHTTQGGFSGKLLNGNYTEYYLNKNLKEQGQFKGGLKDGAWKSWNDKGTLTALYNWDQGLLSGKFELFDNDGKLKQLGFYKNNLQEGKSTTYSTDGRSETVYYEKGKATERKPSSFLDRINLIKRLKKDSSNRSSLEKMPAAPSR